MRISDAKAQAYIDHSLSGDDTADCARDLIECRELIREVIDESTGNNPDLVSFSISGKTLRKARALVEENPKRATEEELLRVAGLSKTKANVWISMETCHSAAAAAQELLRVRGLLERDWVAHGGGNIVFTISHLREALEGK